MMMYNRRRMKAWRVVVIIISMVVTCTVALAQGKDKGRGDEPLGWQKGEKKGWEGDALPKIEKKSYWIPPYLSKDEETEWKNGRPPGWSRGEKKGWNGANVPPGLAKKGGGPPPGLAKSTPPGWEKW